MIGVRIGGMRRIIRSVITAAVVILLDVSTGEAAGRRVLVLQSMERGVLSLDYFSGNFRVDLDEASPDPVTFTQFVVNPSGFAVAPDQAMIAYLRSGFADQPDPDLVITIGGPAAAFARRHRQDLFPASPLLFAAVDERFLAGVPLAENETAVAVRNDIPGLFDDMLRLFPQTSNVFVIVGRGELSRFWQPVLERELRRTERHVSVTWSDRMSLTETLQRASELPRHSVIFFMTFETDAKGGSYPEERVFRDLRAAANAPLFASQGPQLGHGIVGGRLMSVEQLARITAGVALRILQGEVPAHIKVPVQPPGPAVFDWRELRRWNVPEDRLPQGSIIRFREPSAWQRYKWGIVAGGAALFVQALLIATLLVNRAKRQRAEQSLRSNVADLETARGALSHLSGRLMVAQEEERTRLARELHDDIGQRMSFLAMDVARLRDTLADNADALGEAQGLEDAVIAIGRDVQGISHRLHSSKIDLIGLPAAASNFCRELAGRHDVKVECTYDGIPARLPEGVAISVFRVLQEALANVLKHAHADQCRVTLDGADNALRLVVSDNGRGFDASDALNGHGLGLISMQERLKLVDGHVQIESNVGRGTVVRAMVPLPPPARIQSQETLSAAGPAAPSATI